MSYVQQETPYSQQVEPFLRLGGVGNPGPEIAQSLTKRVSRCRFYGMQCGLAASGITTRGCPADSWPVVQLIGSAVLRLAWDAVADLEPPQKGSKGVLRARGLRWS